VPFLKKDAPIFNYFCYYSGYLIIFIQKGHPVNMHRIITFFSLMIFMCFTKNYSMELVEKKPYTFKRFVTIPLSDGSYELERWKMFQCINLLRHCVQHDKDLSPDKLKSLPKFDNACVKEMDLISKGLDRDPGEDYFNYMQSLSAQEEHTLITAIGWDNEKTKKVHVPSLLAPFVGMVLGDIYEKVAHHFSEGNWIHKCYKGVIKENLSSQIIPHFWSENSEKDIGVIRQINGAVNYVPLCLTKEKSVYCGPSQQLVALPIDEQDGADGWPTCCSKIVKEWEFRITSTASCGTERFPSIDGLKNYYMWALNQNTKNAQKILIDKHTEDIKDFIFSNLGEYAVSYSKNEVCVTQIIAQENNQF
jgi:hypothetical protein